MKSPTRTKVLTLTGHVLAVAGLVLGHGKQAAAGYWGQPSRGVEMSGESCHDVLWCSNQALLRTAMQIRAQRLDEFLWGEVTIDETQRIRTLTPPVRGKVSSRFGVRRHPVLGYVRNHNGIDISAPAGEAVRAAAPGIVLRVGERGDYGLAVEIDHGNAITTRYAHLSRIDVVEGDVVARLTLLGQVGSTGLSTGPHLHFELRREGQPTDPLAHIDERDISGNS